MTSPLRSAILLGSPSYPNAIAWSDDNLIAVASGHIVTILRPDLPNGPRGVIKVSESESLPIGVVERKDLRSGCLLSACLARDDKPSIRSLSWSPLGMAANSGCLLAVCTIEGIVKVYRPPFCDFCSEWIEVLDITERMYEYLQSTELGDWDIPSRDQSKVSEIISSGLLLTAPDQMEPVSKSKEKSSKKTSKNKILPLITADQYAFRSSMLFSLVVSWSPLLHVTSEFHPVPNPSKSVSLLAVGGKSGKIYFWRFHEPDCYTIQGHNVQTAVKFVGLLQAHNSWVTSISWVLFTSGFSNSQILLATGSSDGSVKVWLGNKDKLLESSEVNQSLFSLLKEFLYFQQLCRFSLLLRCF